MQYKLKHRLSAALMAGAMCCTMIPAASADEIATPETADTAVPEVTDSAAPDISQITENLYNDLPDAPTGSYLGSMGLPVATGETKISISAWVSDLYDGADPKSSRTRKVSCVCRDFPTASTSSWKRRCQKMFFRPNRSLSPSMRPARRAALLCPPAASQRPAAAT